MNRNRREFLGGASISAAGLIIGAGLKREAQVASSSNSVTVSVPELANGSVQVSQSVTLPPAVQAELTTWS